MAGQEEVAAAFLTIHHRRIAATHAILQWWANDEGGLAATTARLASWQDRTGNARASIQAMVEYVNETFSLYVKAGGPPPYSAFLELGMAGRYATLWPTMQAMLPDIIQDLCRIWLGGDDGDTP